MRLSGTVVLAASAFLVHAFAAGNSLNVTACETSVSTVFVTLQPSITSSLGIPAVSAGQTSILGTETPSKTLSPATYLTSYITVHQPFTSGMSLAPSSSSHLNSSLTAEGPQPASNGNPTSSFTSSSAAISFSTFPVSVTGVSTSTSNGSVTATPGTGTAASGATTPTTLSTTFATVTIPFGASPYSLPASSTSKIGHNVASSAIPYGDSPFPLPTSSTSQTSETSGSFSISFGSSPYPIASSSTFQSGQPVASAATVAGSSPAGYGIFPGPLTTARLSLAASPPTYSSSMLSSSTTAGGFFSGSSIPGNFTKPTISILPAGSSASLRSTITRYGSPSAGYGSPGAGYGSPSAGYGSPSAGWGSPSAGYIPASTSSSSTRLSAASTPATPTSTPSPHCGEFGNFTLTWDDEPSFAPADNATAPYPPVFNPYHQLFFSNGYAHVPPPNSPFTPVSPPRMAMFLTGLENNSGTANGSPDAAGLRPGEIDDGPHAALNAFWFDAFGAYLGCDNAGPGDCTMVISGFAYDGVSGQEVQVVGQNTTLPPCPGFIDCQMTSVNFLGGFTALSGIQIQAFVNGTVPKIWFMDNLRMGWFNNTCAAGLLRQMGGK